MKTAKQTVGMNVTSSTVNLDSLAPGDCLTHPGQSNRVGIVSGAHAPSGGLITVFWPDDGSEGQFNGSDQVVHLKDAVLTPNP